MTRHPAGAASTAGAFLLALAFFGVTRQATVFSDGLWLATMVEHDPAPHHNAAYLPLGALLHRGLGPLFGWSAFEALTWLSVLAGAGTLAVVERSLARLAVGAAPRALCLALLAVTPSAWFFSTVAEVHGVQLLGAALATHLALVARAAPTRRALVLVVAAAALLAATHLTSLLALPGIAWLAVGEERGRGATLRAAPADLVPAAAALACAGALAAGLAVRGAHAGGDPWNMALVFAEEFVRRLRGSGLFGPGEVAGFLASELLRPAGVLLAVAALGLFRCRRRRLLVPATLALLPYVALLPQGGIREEGGYFVTLLPLLTLVAGCACDEERRRGRGAVVAGALVVAIVLQAGLGLARRERLGADLDPRRWRAELEALCPPGSFVFTSSLPRWQSFAAPGGDLTGVDLARELQMVPRRSQDTELRAWLAIARAVLARGDRLFFDADLLTGDGRPPSWQRLEELLAEYPVRLTPLPAPLPAPLPGDVPLLYEAVLVPTDG